MDNRPYEDFNAETGNRFRRLFGVGKRIKQAVRDRLNGVSGIEVLKRTNDALALKHRVDAHHKREHERARAWHRRVAGRRGIVPASLSPVSGAPLVRILPARHPENHPIRRFLLQRRALRFPDGEQG